MTYSHAQNSRTLAQLAANMDTLVAVSRAQAAAMDRLVAALSGTPVVSAPVAAQVAAPTLLAIPAGHDGVVQADGRIVCPRHPEHTHGTGEHVKLGFSANGFASHAAWCKAEAK